MCHRSSDGCEPEPIGESEECAQVNPPLLMILIQINLKVTIND